MDEAVAVLMLTICLVVYGLTLAAAGFIIINEFDNEEDEKWKNLILL